MAKAMKISAKKIAFKGLSPYRGEAVAMLVDLSESGKDPFTSRQEAQPKAQAYSDHLRSRLAWVLTARSAAAPSGSSLASVSRIR